MKSKLIKALKEALRNGVGAARPTLQPVPVRVK